MSTEGPSKNELKKLAKGGKGSGESGSGVMGAVLQAWRWKCRKEAAQQLRLLRRLR
jgi:hypothetical protein